MVSDAPLVTSETSTNGVCCPPRDLYSDEPELESSLHLAQLLLLLQGLNWFWKDRTDYFAAGNLTVYYNAQNLKSKDFRGPDFFVALGAEKRPRKSWIVWEEDGKYPNVIVELLSESTAAIDRGPKKQLYQDTFRTPDYFWFDPDTLEFQGFHLVDGIYEPIVLTEQGWRWSQQLGLYLGIHQDQLRFFTSEGQLIPTPEESAEAERQRADAEQQRADAERQHNETLRARLRQLGIDPEQV